MEKEKFLRLVEKLISQGYKKEQINSFILACRDKYQSQDEIYDNLKEFIMTDLELSNELYKKESIKVLEVVNALAKVEHVRPTMEAVLNYDKENPIITEYLKNI